MTIDFYFSQEIFKPGTAVPPKSRRQAYVTDKTHARIKHDYATWHPDHLDKIERKTSNKIPYSNKSKFDSAKIIPEAIKKSDKYSALVGNNRNFVIIFDMGYKVGYDSIAERDTSCVTVVTKQTGEVITVYPGK